MFNTLTRMGAAGAGGAYEIEKSLRFNSADSATLTRTFGTPTNTDKYTWSCWLKRTKFHDSAGHFGLLGNDGWSVVRFSADRLYWRENGIVNITTTRKWRDCAAWYHIVLRYDSSLVTSSDRAQIWVNGVRETDFTSASYPSQNQNSFINSAIAQRLGGYTTSEQFIDGYLAEIHFVDGQGLDPDNFAETDTDTGQWIPKKYEGTYGDNGYYLKFNDNSGTTATTLGKDSSGNGNNWTPNNFSVSAGVGNDSLEDTPTNNFCTLNSQIKPYGTNTFSQGNLHVDPSNDWNLVEGTFVVKTGKWYWEQQGGGSVGPSSRVLFGICSHNSFQQNAQNPQTYSGTIGYYDETGQKRVNNTYSSYGDSYNVTGDVIGTALDMDNRTVTFYKNGTSQGAIDLDDANDDFLEVTPACFIINATEATFNFGQRPFAHSAPANHKTLCTANLNEPPILDGSEYFKTVIYTGDNGTARDIAVGFQPDMVWIKNRDQVDWHLLQDSVRGATKSLYVNVDHGENTELANGHVNSFGSNGFQVDFGSSGNVNANGEDYASWSWKESASAGFDILTYTGNATNRTISHSLGVKPCMYVVKRTDGSGNWTLWHKGLAANGFMYFDTNAGKYEGSSYNDVWNNTEPTSSVFSLGTSGGPNGNGNSYVAYLWAEVDGYCKAGTFIGNGADDGTFVYTGFEPAYIIWKSTSGEHWQIRDNVRKTFNSAGEPGIILFGNDHSAEYTGNANTDFLSNGFKCRTDAGGTNGNGQTHIYLAFAEQPFKYANAR